MKKWLKRSGPESILVLAFDGSQLQAQVVHKSNSSPGLLRPIPLTFSADIKTGDPDGLGDELRAQLDAAGIRERSCVVGLPAEWLLSRLVSVPDLPAEDVESFFELEAERGFPYSLEELMLGRSGMGVLGNRFELLMAITRDNLERWNRLVRKARLEPQSFSLGAFAWDAATPTRSDGGIRILVYPHQLLLLIHSASGWVAFRQLGTEVRTSGESPTWRGDALMRELRITVGQLPTAVRSELRTFKVVGSAPSSEEVARLLGPLFQSWSLVPEAVAAGEDATPFPQAEVWALARRGFTAPSDRFEFLPPRITSWQLLTARYSSPKLAYVGAALGAVAALVLAAVGIQEYRLHSLNSQWSAMSTRVHELEDMQQNIRKFRPWYDESIRTLRILRRLTLAFPEDGSVTAKSLEIHDPGVVACSCTARDNASLLKVLDALRAAPEVTEVEVDQVRSSKPPLQFTFNLRWESASQP